MLRLGFGGTETLEEKLQFRVQWPWRVQQGACRMPVFRGLLRFVGLTYFNTTVIMAIFIILANISNFSTNAHYKFSVQFKHFLVFRFHLYILRCSNCKYV